MTGGGRKRERERVSFHHHQRRDDDDDLLESDDWFDLISKSDEMVKRMMVKVVEVMMMDLMDLNMDGLRLRVIDGVVGL